MKVLSALAVVAASSILTASAKHGDIHPGGLEHRHLHHKGRALSIAEGSLTVDEEERGLGKRTGQCAFPKDAGLVPVPGSSNGGWAMSPDECCEPGGYCPYACPPGQVSMQWDPKATSYSYPQSMNGGLFCDKSGKIQKPFPNKPYCADGSGNVGCRNKASGNVAICQTVLPGNEAMLIPTNVETSATLAIPGPEYWAGTAAHFYVNPPGVSPEDGCVWGTAEKPQGNWAPYVLGGNAVDGGETFIKLGWNPIYLEPATPFRDEKPTFGIEIVCDGDDCNGLPCAIDPSQHGVNELVGGAGSSGAGGAVSCVVTVPAGGGARFVIHEIGGTGSDKDQGDTDKHDQHPSNPPSSSHDTPPPPPSPPTTSPTSSSISSSKIEETATQTPSSSTSTTASSTPSSTPTPAPSSTPSSPATLPSTPTPNPASSLTRTSELESDSSSSSSLSSSFSSSHEATTSSAPVPTNTSQGLPVHPKAPPPKPLKYTYKPHIFADNSTATMTVASGSAVGSASVSAPSSQGSSTGSSMRPPAIQSQMPNGAAYTHITVAAFGLTALAAVAIVAL
ncbi:MAG: hypothetical protein Q9208_002213 [Pyrenodesmia sp. 3 TL-2023]